MVAWNRVSTNRDYIQDLYGWDITQIKYKVRNEGIDFNVISMSVQFSCLLMSDSSWPHGLQHTRFPCPSPTPGAYSKSCLLSQWCHSSISSSVVPFSTCQQSLPGSGFFPNESIIHIRWPKYWSFSFSISPSKEHPGLISSEWTGWISLQSKGLSRVFSNTTVQKHQFLGILLSSQSNSHSHTWRLEKP